MVDNESVSGVRCELLMLSSMSAIRCDVYALRVHPSRVSAASYLCCVVVLEGAFRFTDFDRDEEEDKRALALVVASGCGHAFYAHGFYANTTYPFSWKN